MSIDTLKSTIGKRGGAAAANKFSVFFTPPKQSLINKNPTALIGALLSGGGIGALINDPRDISLLCENVTLPGRQISTLDYGHDKEMTRKQPYGVIDEEVTMTFMLTNDMYIKTVFDDWLGCIYDSETYRIGYKKDFSTDVVIQQLNHKELPVYGVKLINAFPTTIAGITMDNNSENTIQKLTVTLSYDKYIQEDALSSTLSAVTGAANLLTNL
jgi:hypothetical protein